MSITFDLSTNKWWWWMWMLAAYQWTQVSWLGMKIGGHLVLSLHSSHELAELLQWLWSPWQHHRLTICLNYSVLYYYYYKLRTTLQIYDKNEDVQPFFPPSTCSTSYVYTNANLAQLLGSLVPCHSWSICKIFSLLQTAENFQQNQY